MLHGAASAHCWREACLHRSSNPCEETTSCHEPDLVYGEAPPATTEAGSAPIAPGKPDGRPPPLILAHLRGESAVSGACLQRLSPAWIVPSHLHTFCRSRRNGQSQGAADPGRMLWLVAPVASPERSEWNAPGHGSVPCFYADRSSGTPRRGASFHAAGLFCLIQGWQRTYHTYLVNPSLSMTRDAPHMDSVIRLR